MVVERSRQMPSPSLSQFNLPGNDGRLPRKWFPLPSIVYCRLLLQPPLRTRVPRYFQTRCEPPGALLRGATAASKGAAPTDSSVRFNSELPVPFRLASGSALAECFLKAAVCDCSSKRAARSAEHVVCDVGRGERSNLRPIERASSFCTLKFCLV